ncbi:MAG: Gfo/Idh/MocA family oxidoreductase [Kiritimatiellae bacterium]|nr:Gfo/Idh/MocA family oxidoreductase [Kiritimatiellia bacterium]
MSATQPYGGRGRSLRWGVVGLGTIGADHAERISRTRRARLTAVCSRDPAKRAIAERLGCAFVRDHRELVRSGLCDALLIATPHYAHVPIALDALRAGLHVLVEKPVAVTLAEAQRLLEAARVRPAQRAGVMFQMRTEPVWHRMAALLRDRVLGELQRVTWVVTDWFRPDAYYRAAGWRGSWATEGGGVLVNQCPHQLDLWLHLFGPPSKVCALAGFGRRHPIEVEDEAAALFEYSRGLTGVFITSTGEAPGERRLAVAGTGGLAVVEGTAIRLRLNQVRSDRFARDAREPFAKPPARERTIECGAPREPPHEAVIRNFVEAVLDDAPLVAPLEDGVRQVELANAILWSALRERPVPLPLDARAFERLHRSLRRRSGAADRTSRGHAQRKPEG